MQDPPPNPGPDAPLPAGDGPLWVFGYGSLIWNPGFPHVRRAVGSVAGYHRSFCMRSIHHRGTEAAPGLVLALEPRTGAACSGIAFEVAPQEAAGTVTALRARELISSAYVEAEVSVQLAEGGRVTALTYVIDLAHPQYCGGLALEEQARIIAGAVGGRGPNRDYLVSTAAHLRELGLADPELDWLVARVHDMTAT